MKIADFGSSPPDLGAGIYFKAKHFQDILQSKPPVDWFEVHSENYMSRGGVSLKQLEAIRKNYPVSVHGVSLSLGSAEPLCQAHLQGLKKLIDWIDPILVSEHLAWSRFEGAFLNDLLPIPYTSETLQTLCDHIDQTQEILQRQILIENPSTYVIFKDSTIAEPDFLAQAIQRTGCGLLLDVNNIYVSACNHKWDAAAYLQSIPVDCVREIHLAGHAERAIGEHILRIDDHGSKVCDAVWDLYKKAIERFGRTPTMIEWDTDVPSLDTLVGEAAAANLILQRVGEGKNVLAG